MAEKNKDKKPALDPNAYNLLFAQQIGAAASATTPQIVANPKYGSNVFDPNAYQRYLYGTTQQPDPTKMEPYPYGAYVDPRIQSDLNAVRMNQAQEFRANPKAWAQANAPDLVNEQSLLDRGKSMLSQLFDYRDDSDWHVGGINLSAVESLWDGAVAHYIGAYDLLNIGFGGLISAMPGGVQTIDYNTLSGGKSVGEVLNGQMEPGSAPSPGQIALASIAKESKRIREGGQRWSDLLLLSPVTAPFIMAGMATPDSALQKDNFDLTNKAQRDAAFGTGWEHWMSGITDAGLALADPLIGVGAAGKILRAGALGVRTNALYNAAARPQYIAAADEIVGKNAFGEAEDLIASQAPREASGARGSVKPNVQTEAPFVADDATKQPAVKQVMNGITPSAQAAGVLSSTAPGAVKPKRFKSILADFLWDVTARNADGTQAMSIQDIKARKEIRALKGAAKEAVASALYHTNSPVIAALILGTMSEDPKAIAMLGKLLPATQDALQRVAFEQAHALRLMEPQKMAEAISSVERRIESIGQYKRSVESLLEKEPIKNDPSMFAVLKDKQKEAEIVLDQANEMKTTIRNGVVPDKLDPASSFYNPAAADAIMSEIHSQGDSITKALNDSIRGAAVNAGESRFAVLDNPYSRMVMASRARRATALSQYIAEGTSILPRKAIIEVVHGVDKAGKPIEVERKFDRTGWFAESQFDDVSRWRRNARVWRWAGTATPSGFIGLKGTALLGSDTELAAAMDIDLYRNAAVKITRKDADGNIIGDTPDEVGGAARKQELLDMWAKGIADPLTDNLHLLTRIEDEIAADLAKAYGVTEDAMKEMMGRANKIKDANLELLRNHGYFIDPSDGSRHYVPFLESQLANGSYMHNFGAFEMELKKNTGFTLNERLSRVENLIDSSYGAFNNIWRPATLLRLTYTTRNVTEGLVRAVAYSGSLAPLGWPIKATYYGIRNGVVAKNAAKKAKIAEEIVSQTEYARLRGERDTLWMQEREFHNLVPSDDPDTVSYLKLVDGNREVVTLPKDEYDLALQDATDKRVASEASMQANISEFEAAIDDTEFGTWRGKQIKALNGAIRAQDSKIALLDDFHGKIDADGNTINIIEEYLPELQSMHDVRNHLEDQLTLLTTDPQRALSGYRESIGRAKRIGNGTSLGPNGLPYEDALASTIEWIYRQQLSSDNTVKQQLSADARVAESLFRRIGLKTNTPIEWSAIDKKQQVKWITGMAHVIETDSSSRLVQRLVQSNWDIEDAVSWIMTGKDDRWWLNYSNAQAVSEKTLKDINVEMPVSGEYLFKPGEIAPSVAGASRELPKIDEVRHVVQTTVDLVYKQMQDNPEFLRILEERSRQKALKPMQVTVDGKTKVINLSGVTGNALSPDVERNVRQVLDAMPPDQRDRLGFVQGYDHIDLGTNSAYQFWIAMTSKLFDILGRIPEDAFVRAPFYNMQFRVARNDLIASYLQSVGKGHLLKGRYATTSAGKDIGKGIEHEQFTIPAKEMTRIMHQAHEHALSTTREYLYTIERRTKLGKYGEAFSPFISASQNSVTVVGKLLYRQPWLAPMIADFWKMPNRAGFEDEEGNLHLPMPLPWVTDFLKDHPEIPFVGGAVDSSDEITIPKNMLNLWVPETGFGVAPTPTPIVQVAASELMKHNVFPVDTPDIVKAVMGPEIADTAYQKLKDYIFGENRTMSEKPLSWDMIVPSLPKLAIQSKDELSKNYGALYQAIWVTQTMRYQAGERENAPEPNEINKRVTNLFWLDVMGQAGLPTFIAPYPTLGRARVQSSATVLQGLMRTAQSIDPKTASQNMLALLDEGLLQGSISKVTQSVGGADPNAAAIGDITKFSDLIRRVSPKVGNNLDVLGIITNNRDSVVTFVPNSNPNGTAPNPDSLDQASLAWQLSNNIPGRSDNWRKTNSPQEATAERQRLAGWTVYSKFMDVFDGQLHSAGLSNYNVKGAAQFKMARDQLVRGMLENPEYAGWATDFLDQGGGKAQAAVTVLQEAVSDKTFQSEMVKSGNVALLDIMNQYVQARTIVMNHVKASGKPLSDLSNAQVKDMWDTMRQSWKQQDVRWNDIATQYLEKDDSPQFVPDTSLNSVGE
jgi:hypothetical protein